MSKFIILKVDDLEIQFRKNSIIGVFPLDENNYHGEGNIFCIYFYFNCPFIEDENNIKEEYLTKEARDQRFEEILTELDDNVAVNFGKDYCDIDKAEPGKDETVRGNNISQVFITEL